MEDELARVIDALAGLVWIALPSGLIEFVNQRWRDYTGWGSSNADSTWQAVVHPDDLPGITERLEPAPASPEPIEVEARLRGHNGEYRWFLMRAAPLADESGRLVKWCGMNTDIEHRKRAELAALEREARLQSVLHDLPALRVTSLGALTASIAHEVNQPLAGIITNANTCLRMLATEPPNIDGARETARRTIRDGSRAAEVVARLRALYARKAPTLESVDLNEATREVIALSRGELVRSKATMRAELAEDLPIIMGDRVQLQQVIMNLIRNAVDAMIGIDDRPREIVIRTFLDDGDRACLSVRDSGAGFGSQDAAKVFDAFYTTKPDGMGIGLSVSRSIVESHRGRLWAVPNDGPGVTFSFAIPCGLDFGVHAQRPRAAGNRDIPREAHTMGAAR